MRRVQLLAPGERQVTTQVLIAPTSRRRQSVLIFSNLLLVLSKNQKLLALERCSAEL